jgi:alpha-tubulin suppressor-like RCC1 family protein
MNQYLTDKSQIDNPCYLPRLLAALPEGEEIKEVWCGSEFTIVADTKGRCWGSGWNEHGNLGCGVTLNNANECDWKPILSNSTVEKSKNPIRISFLWEGALSCGGGHAIAII